MGLQKNRISSGKIRKIGGTLLLIGFVLLSLVYLLSIFERQTTAILSGISVLMIVAGSVMLLHSRVSARVYITGTIVTLSIIVLTFLLVHLQLFLEQIVSVVWITGLASLLAPIFILLWVIDSRNSPNQTEQQPTMNKPSEK